MTASSLLENKNIVNILKNSGLHSGHHYIPIYFFVGDLMEYYLDTQFDHCNLTSVFIWQVG